MMKLPTSLRFASVLGAMSLLASCSLIQSDNPGTSEMESSSTSSNSSASDGLMEDTTPTVTNNVSYSGILEELGVSIYQQGSHQLRLQDGGILILESTDANLNLQTYLGKNVEVKGSTQATVEAGGLLLRVTEVTVLDASSSTSSLSSSSATMCGGIAGIPCAKGQECMDDPSDDCDPARGGADCSGVCVGVLKESSSSSEQVSSVSSSSSSNVSSSSSSVSSFSSSSSANSSAFELQITTMAKQAYDEPSLWTQAYCTSHIAFCIPVHKNWYFKSFGATTSNLWHVEFSMETINQIGDGPISINLVSGTSASMNARDGQVKSQGSDVIAFKDWKDNTHFELIADARLKAAVEYMIGKITSYEPVQ